MFVVFLQVLPFFALIACGYLAARTGFFPASAAANLTKFVFYFALSAMLFRIAATLPFEEIWKPDFLMAYLIATTAIYAVILSLALLRGQELAAAGFEAQTSVIGNTGFLGLPMFILLLGAEAAAPVLMMLAVDLVVFGTLAVIFVEVTRGGGGVKGALIAVSRIIKNPMIVSMTLGLLWSRSGVEMPQPLEDFTRILGGAATPAALFAIGCSLAAQSAERQFGRAFQLSLVKLIAHPLLVWVTMVDIFGIEPRMAAIAAAAAALPTAGNIYILAEHYKIAVHRVSATIFVSTVMSIVTVTLALSWLGLAG